MRYHDDTFVDKAFKRYLNADDIQPIAFAKVSRMLYSKERKQAFSKLVADYENGEVKI